MKTIEELKAMVENGVVIVAKPRKVMLDSNGEKIEETEVTRDEIISMTYHI